MRHMEYFIHGCSVGSDHSPVQIGICMGQKCVRKSPFKWNAFKLRGEIATQLRQKWASLPQEHTFFSKQVSRLYQVLSIKKTKNFGKGELDLRAKLKQATTYLHEDVYNMEKNGKVEELKNALEGVERRKTWGATIRSGVKWNNKGNKCSTEFSKQPNIKTLPQSSHNY